MRHFHMVGAWIVFAVTINAWADFAPGVCVHFTNTSRTDIQANLDLLQKAGVKSIRMDIGWKYIETVKGQYKMVQIWDDIVTYAAARGIQTLLILDYNNPFYDGGDKPTSDAAIAAYANYARFVVGYFKGRVNTFEIYNEWDTHTGGVSPGTPENYMRLLKFTYPLLKKTAPSATFAVGVTSDQTYNSLVGDTSTNANTEYTYQYFNKLVDLGLINYGDAVSVHPYVVHNKGLRKSAEGYIELMTAIDAKLRSKNGGKSFPVVVSEINWSTAHPSLVQSSTLDDQANFIVQSLIWSQTTSYVRGIWLYDFKDDDLDPLNYASNFGIRFFNNAPKPAFNAYSEINALMGASHYVSTVFQSTINPQQVRSVRFEKNQGSGGNYQYYFWSIDGQPRKFKTICPGADPNLIMDRIGQGQTSLACGSVVTVTGTPVMLEGYIVEMQAQ